LANILRDQQKYQEAIELYKKCVEIHSTYTLVYCNMAMCYLKTEMYQDAFAAFARAKELLPTDNNGLS
jgi:tetratricopeptide (TPR) repeat protein